MTDRLRDVIAQIDLRQMVEQFWGAGKRSGRAVMYFAHWRDDGNRPSFAVYANGFKDFGSGGESGDAVRFIERELNLSRPDAIAWILNYLGGTAVITAPPAPLLETSPHEPPPAAWQTALREAVERTQAALWSATSSKVLAYLRRDRHLSDHTIRTAGLGYAPGYIKTNYSYNDENGNKFVVSIPPGIVIPWEIDGVLWAVRVRSRVGSFAQYLGIPDDRFTTGDRSGEIVDKYRSARGSRPGGALYGADHIRSGSPVFLFEGEFDTLLAQQEMDDQGACVTFGSASSVPRVLPARWRGFFDDVPAVYSALDADDAGRTATERLIVMFGSRHHALNLPPGAKDITEAAQHGESIRLWAQQAAAERVPDSWITALLHLTDADGQHRGAGAPVYYAIIESISAGHLRPEGFTVAELQQALTGSALHLSGDLLRDGLHVLVENGLIDKAVAKIEPINDEKLSKNPGGRPADVYALPSIDRRRAALIEGLAPRLRELAYPIEDRPNQPATIADLTPRALADVGLNPHDAEKLHTVTLPAKDKQAIQRAQAARRELRLQQRLIDALDDSTVTPMPQGWRLDTLFLFRVAFLRALKLGGHVGSSLNDIALTLGISKPSVNKYVGQAGFLIETNQRAAVPLNRSGSIERQVRAGAAAVQGKPLQIDAYYADGTHRTMSYSAEAAEAAVAQANLVQVIYQVANKHTPIESAPPPRPPRRTRPARRPVISTEAESANLGESESVIQQDSANFDAPIRKAGYRRAWVEGQLRLCCRVLGWITQDGRIFNPDSGEILDSGSSIGDLFRVLVQVG